MKTRIFGICLLLLALVAMPIFAGCGECEHVYDHVCDTVCNTCGAERTVSGHRYDNDCDTRCNKCNALREVGEHKYTAPCDGTCDICEANREAADHVYDNACDALCNACNAMREVGDHVYDNACDAFCNECEAERTVGEHEYRYDCDSDCDICGFVREAEAHTFDSNCDTQCNVCGEKTGPAANHSYSSVCDTDCDACGEKRITESEHIYSGPCDAECNSCGYVRGNLNHSWSAWRSNYDATCVEDGTKTRKCSVCKMDEWAVDEGTATGHYFLSSDGYQFNNDATHYKDGTESEKCYLCGYARSTRPAVGSAGHSFDGSGRCKECGLVTPALGAYMTYDSFEAYQKVGQAFTVSNSKSYTAGKVQTTAKTGVTYTIVSRGKLADSNIRALKIARAASSNTTGNDTIVDVLPRSASALASKHVIEFEIMIGSGNETNIYLNGRKEKNGSAVFNQFVWYNDARKSVYIGSYEAVTGVKDDEWFKVALVIDDEAKTYTIYADGQLAAAGIPYVKSDEYYSFSECVVNCYRFTANKGTTAVEFYLDNIKLYNGDYVG